MLMLTLCPPLQIKNISYVILHSESSPKVFLSILPGPTEQLTPSPPQPSECILLTGFESKMCALMYELQNVINTVVI